MLLFFKNCFQKTKRRWFVFQINQSVMEAALSPDMLATDLAYYLVRKGVSGVYVFSHSKWKL